jgi:hypothetical protein
VVALDHRGVVVRLSRSPRQVNEEVKALVRNGGCIFPEAEIRDQNGPVRATWSTATTYLPSARLTDKHEDGVVTFQGFTNR